MSERARFFTQIRVHLFNGRLQQSQVDGINFILAAAPAGIDRRWLAYALATTQHETGATMRPIEEWGKGEGRLYGSRDAETGHVYYGRGYVQLTWRDNYRRMGELLGVDLEHRPELALDPTLAAKIMFEGMSRGLFTGRKFADFFNAERTDWHRARMIINGLDRAALIAAYAVKYDEALGL